MRRDGLDAAVFLEREIDRHVVGTHPDVRERAVRADVDGPGAAVAALAQDGGLHAARIVRQLKSPTMPEPPMS